MGFFGRNEQHIEVAAEKPDLERAIREARDARQQAETALEAHDAEHARLVRQFEATTTDFDQATLRGDEKAIESLVSQRFACEQKIASLDRVRGHRANQVERARQALFEAEKDGAREQQESLIAEKAALNKRIVQSVEALAALIEESESKQVEIDTLDNEWKLDHRPQLRLLLPGNFVRSRSGEALRNALNLARAFGIGPDAFGRIVKDDAEPTSEDLDTLIEEQVAEEEALAGLAGEVSHG